MALQNGTRGAGIAKGGYKPKPFKNDSGMQKLTCFVPERTLTRIKGIAAKEDVPISQVACYAIMEYFHAIDENDEH